MANHRDEVELCGKIDPNDPPQWKRMHYFAREFGDRKLAYLAVAVMAGDEVVGIIRVAGESGIIRFEEEERRLRNRGCQLTRPLPFPGRQDCSHRLAAAAPRKQTSTPNWKSWPTSHLRQLPSCIGAVWAGIRILDGLGTT